MGAFTEKQVNKVQNSILKKSKTLSGACKLYNDLFKNQSDLKAVCKELDVPVAIATQLSTIAKTKDATLNICYEMLAKVDNTFVRLVSYSKVYKDKSLSDKNTSISKSMSDKIVSGTEYKSFGYCSPIKYSESPSPYYKQNDNDNYTQTHVAIKYDSYSILLVSKCVSRYLTGLNK